MILDNWIEYHILSDYSRVQYVDRRVSQRIHVWVVEIHEEKVKWEMSWWPLTSTLHYYKSHSSVYFLCHSLSWFCFIYLRY